MSISTFISSPITRLLLHMLLKLTFSKLSRAIQLDVDHGGDSFNKLLEPYFEPYQISALETAFYTIHYNVDHIDIGSGKTDWDLVPFSFASVDASMSDAEMDKAVSSEEEYSGSPIDTRRT